jgi:NADH-quinone oxidoreductase subunit C
MNRTELTGYIKSLEMDCEIREGKQFPEVIISAEKFHSFVLKLKQDEKSSFDFLFCITGVDYGKDLGVVYHLRSTRYEHSIVVKVRTSDRENPHFDTVTDIWETAEFHEREVYDLLGIKFTNHPDLRRLFLDNSWGFPLRKDYVDDINIVTK